MKTLREIKMNRQQALVNGHVWDLHHTVSGKTIELTRVIQVKRRHRRTGILLTGSYRRLVIRRPIGFLAESV